MCVHVQGYKDRPALLADCAALMGIELSYDDMESDTEDTDRSETAVDYEGDSGSESGADSGEYVPGRKDGIATEVGAVRQHTHTYTHMQNTCPVCTAGR